MRQRQILVEYQGCHRQGFEAFYQIQSHRIRPPIAINLIAIILESIPAYAEAYISISNITFISVC